MEIVRNIYKVFEAGSPQEKREVVQLVASNGVLRDKTVALTWKKPAAILADRTSIPYGVTDGIRTRDLLGHSQALLPG